MEAIDFATPTTVDEAVQLMASKGDRARMMAGGTDILVQLRAGRRSLDLVVDAKGIPELNEISYDPQSGLTLGAAVPCYLIYQNETVASAYPGLIDCASLIGGIQIQGRASIGGNLCNAAPSGDSIPAMIALGGVPGPMGPDRWPPKTFAPVRGGACSRTEKSWSRYICRRHRRTQAPITCDLSPATRWTSRWPGWGPLWCWMHRDRTLSPDESPWLQLRPHRCFAKTPAKAWRANRFPRRLFRKPLKKRWPTPYPLTTCGAPSDNGCTWWVF